MILGDMMKKILCIGHSAYDVTMQTDGYPQENIKYHVISKTECGGGPAANAAYLISKWGATNTYYMGVIGSDLYGKRIIEEFLENDMPLDYVQALQNGETHVSMIIANIRNGSRTIFTYSAKNLKMDLERINFPTDVDVILTDGHELDASIKAFKANPNAITIIDAGRLSQNNIILGQMVDYLVCSKDFAEDHTNLKIDINNPDTLTKMFKELEKTFTNQIIITLGENGSLYKKDNEVVIVPTIKVKALDTTGAGDIYHGAFTYAISNGYSIYDAMKIGSIAGALSVTKLGSRPSIPTLEEVLVEYDKLK